jgi:Ca2+-binding EF-hand superfamily protein
MSADPLTKLAMELVSHTLCADQVLSLRVEFQAMDRQHVGTVSAQELIDALRVSQHPALLHGVLDLASAFEAMSIQRSSGRAGGLAFHEYIAAAMSKRLLSTSSQSQ